MTENWTSGYVAEIDYTFGYYPELNPLHGKLAFLASGLSYPVVRSACELGFGQGISINLHAAGNKSTTWYGTDFNPSQACFARDLTEASGVNVGLFDQAFAEFCTRDDLPDFDYIGLHGIWTWVSDENRKQIVDFIRRKLAVGGVLYISYNTLPGWSAAAPLRHLMTEYASSLSARGQGIVKRIDAALDFSQQLIDIEPLYIKANPQIADRFAQMKSSDRSYMAHEYFNRDWNPMYFANMAQWLEPAKLSYACSANLFDLVDVINLSDDQQRLLGTIPDPVLKQTVRDFIVNQQFRKDLWVKGSRRLSDLERTEQIGAMRVVLVAHRPDIKLKINGPRGELSLSEAVYGPLLDLLSDYKVRTIGELQRILKDRDISGPQVVQAVVLMVGAGKIAVCQDDDSIKASLKPTQKINRELILKARSRHEIAYLSSPVIASGVMVSRFEQLFILAIQQGKKTPYEWAGFVWDILASQGQSIVKESKPLGTPDENLEELLSQAEKFSDSRLSILKALQIA